MKRPIAILISAGVTALILVAVLAVSAPTSEPLPAAQAAVTNPPTSSDPVVLRQQLQAALTLMQQREAAYQQRLQEAYAQLQSPQGANAGSVEHEDSAEHENGEEHEGD